MAWCRNQAKPPPWGSGPRGARTPTPAPRASASPRRSPSAPPRPCSASRVGAPGAAGARRCTRLTGPPASASAARAPGPLGEDRLGDLQRRPRRREAGQPGHGDQHLADLVGGHAGAQGTAHVPPELGVRAQRRRDRHRHHRAVAAAEAGTAPQIGEPERRGQLLEVRRHLAPALDDALAQVAPRQLAAALETVVSRGPAHRAPPPAGPTSARGLPRGSRIPSMRSLSGSYCGGSRSSSPSRSAGSSVAKPGPTVAISNSTRPGSRK